MKIDVSGSDQQGRIGEPLQPLQIWLKEDNGERVINAQIRFRLIKGKGTFNHRDDRTDWSGGAIAEFVPEEAGPYRIDCQINGREQKVSFTGEIAEAAQPAPAVVLAAETAQSEPDIGSAIDKLLNEMPAAEPTAAAPEQTAATTAPTVPFELPPVPEPPQVAGPTAAEEQPAAEEPKPAAPPPPETPEPKPTPEPDLSLPDTTDVPDETEPAPSRSPKITLAVMALALGLLIAGMVYLGRGDRTPSPTTVGSGSIDCTHAAAKVVDGDKFVFSGCVKQP